jgi:2-polyprenyl-3-methyl-5-hydroxy-6-metoxy-1,4-benzoquinol methylase
MEPLTAPLYDLGMSVREEQVYAYDNAWTGSAIGCGRSRRSSTPGRSPSSRRGVGRGRRCLEVGAGGGSIALWLADRVAPDGVVVATDRDTTVLDELSHPNLEVRVDDVLEDDLPEREFDVVHVPRLAPSRRSW